MSGANARRRVLEIAKQFPKTRISVLIESKEQAARRGPAQEIGIFIDLNSGMNRTGIGEDRRADVFAARKAGRPVFRGVHFYDGHVKAKGDTTEAHEGYDKLLQVVAELLRRRICAGKK